VRYEPSIGLEIHARLRTKTKLFCPCPNGFGDSPNTRTCPVCLGLPGALPVLNRRAVELAARTAIAFGCDICAESIFARKSYFYPDLPKGYQITQYEKPLATGGRVEIASGPGGRTVGIERIHIEEDSGRCVHDPAGGMTLVDFNRAGAPLVEIVTFPEIRAPAEAAALFRSIRQILVCLDVCDGRMEEGSIRCDANISLSPADSAGFGVRTELKNLNSFRFLERALELEIGRQAAILDSGGSVVQATLLYDQGADSLAITRLKQIPEDYRYFSEPDLPPLRLEEGWIAEIKKNLPELPAQKAVRFVTRYGLPEHDAGLLASSPHLWEGMRKKR
jgi:aspartyl-tRNA(Asn)/glutamyl-tRNA(Gln) amidotransferase subunit B